MEVNEDEEDQREQIREKIHESFVMIVMGIFQILKLERVFQTVELNGISPINYLRVISDKIVRCAQTEVESLAKQKIYLTVQSILENHFDFKLTYGNSPNQTKVEIELHQYIDQFVNNVIIVREPEPDSHSPINEELLSLPRPQLMRSFQVDFNVCVRIVN